jgi:hypothetical protein
MKNNRAAILVLSVAAVFVTTVVAFAEFKSSNDVVANTRYGRGSLPARFSFEKKTSTQRCLTEGDASYDTNDNNDGGSSMFDMSSLNSRLAEIQKKEQTLPLVVLDSMLPRQVLELQVNNALLIELVRDCVTRESPYFGMLGIARLASGQQVHLTRGVEVEILKDRLTFLPEGQGVKMALRATGRRFQIEEGSIKTVGGGDRRYTEAKVQFLDSAQEEEDEVKNAAARRQNDENSDDENSDAEEAYDRTSVARAILQADGFTIPNGNMPNNLSLVDRWIELAREKERSPGQIDALLEDLGEIPPSHQPSERAFWIGALINPLPGMGVALEIRPALLTAKKAEQRVEVALNGILRSINYMDGSARLV